MSDILIPNPSHLQQLIKNIAHDGHENFHVISDFDRTLTTAFVDGKPRAWLENILKNEWYLGPEYTKESKKYFDKYYPIEMDPNIPLESKIKSMQEWRMTIFDLMIKLWLTKGMIKSAMQSDKIKFRTGHEIFFKLLHDNSIPLLIFSANGLWYEGIYYCLERQNNIYNNIGIISNRFIRDQNDKAIWVQEPIIHSYNKWETVVKDFPIYEKIKDKKNILLLGDGLGDAQMADGYDYKNIIRIWFLNNDTPENRQHYQKKFDLIILNDGPMDEVNNILQKLLVL